MAIAVKTLILTVLIEICEKMITNNPHINTLTLKCLNFASLLDFKTTRDPMIQIIGI